MHTDAPGSPHEPHPLTEPHSPDDQYEQYDQSLDGSAEQHPRNDAGARHLTPRGTAAPRPLVGPPGAGQLSAAERVYQHLKRAILEQIHGDGALLTECDIADEVGVSRTPVRAALLRLETEGLVALYPKRGALVLPVSAQEVEDVIEARRLVETHTATRAWLRRGALADGLVPLLEVMRAAHGEADAAAFMLADRAFHQATVDAAGNRILTELYQKLRDRQMRIGIASMRLAPERMSRALADHTALLEILRGDDEAAWHELVSQHLGTAAGHLRPARADGGVAR